MRSRRLKIRESIKEDARWSSEKFIRRTEDELRFKKESVRKAERVVEILEDNFDGQIRYWGIRQEGNLHYLGLSFTALSPELRKTIRRFVDEELSGYLISLYPKDSGFGDFDMHFQINNY